MPPRLYSRYTFCTARTDARGRKLLSDREPYRFANFPDTRVHIVAEGDTLWSLAARYFEGMPRPAGLWWVIADFQPDAIVDPTLTLEPGRAMYIPSVQRVLAEVFSEARRRAEAV